MPIKHPGPTESTIKYLYAHAFSCGYADCREPLFRIDPISSKPHLNSRMCHIHARRENGPRWDSSQTADENRSSDNLIMMCEQHASMIDDEASISAYPPELLRKWKEEQVKTFIEVQAGWALGDESARLIQDLEDKALNVSFSHSHVELGGRGGNAPGAGGGGGSAIGPGARGGDGGKGGSIHEDRGPFTLPNEGPPPTFDLPPSKDGTFPGAGGGGAAAEGPNSRAGDGGDGGDMGFGTIDIAALNEAGFSGEAEVVVGEGGKASLLPGELGKSGSDTIMRFKHKDGSVLKEMKVRGGAAPGPKIPDGTRAVTEHDLDGGLQVTTLMPFNAAEFHNGLISVLGGNWRHLPVPSLPGDLVIHVYAAFRWRDLDIEKEGVGFHLFLTAPDGERISQQPISIPQGATNNGMWHLALPIGATVSDAGEYALQIVSGEFLLAETLIRVEVQSPDKPAQ